MEGRADYPSLLERERQLYAGLSAAAAAARGLGVRPGPAGFPAAGPPPGAGPPPPPGAADSSPVSGLTSSLVRQQLNELARASTPLPPDPLAQLHARYLPHGLPLHNRGYSLMGQFLSNGNTGSSSAEAFKSMLGPGLEHYWSHLSDAMLAEGHSRFGAGAYPPYLPLLSPSESLSLFASHASSSASQSSPIYHRIYDLHKESLLANGLGHLAGSSSGLQPLGPPSSTSPPSSLPRAPSVSSRATPTSSSNEPRAPSRDEKLGSRSSDPTRRSGGADVRSHSHDGRQLGNHDRHDVRRASYDGSINSGSRHDVRCNSLDGRIAHNSRSSSQETCRTKPENRSLSLDGGKHSGRSRDRESDIQRHDSRGREDFPKIKQERSPSCKPERHLEGSKSELKHRHLDEHNITIRHEGKDASDISVQYIHKLKSPDRTMKESKSSKDTFAASSSSYAMSPFKKDRSRTPVKESEPSVVLDLRSPGPIVDIKIDSPSDGSVDSPQQGAFPVTGSGGKPVPASRTEGATCTGSGVSRSTQAEIVITDSPPSGTSRSSAGTTSTSTTFSSMAGSVFTSSKLSPSTGLSVSRESDAGPFIVHHQQAVIAISRSPTNPGRGSPQEGGKVHATTFTPEVGTVAGWYAPSRPPKPTNASCLTSSVTSPSSTTTVTVKSSNSPIMQDRITSPVSRTKSAQSRSKAISPSFKVSCIKQESSPPSCSLSLNSVKQEEDNTSEHARSSECRDGAQSHPHRTNKLGPKDSFICTDIPELIKPDKHESTNSQSLPRPPRTTDGAGSLTRPRRPSADSRTMTLPLDGATKVESPTSCAKMNRIGKEPIGMEAHGRLVGYGGTSEPPIGQPALAIPPGLLLTGFPHPSHHKQLFGSSDRSAETPEVRVKTEDRGNSKREESKQEKLGDQQHVTTTRGKVELPGPGQDKCAQLRSTLLRPENNATKAEDGPALSAGGSIPVGIAIARQRDDRVPSNSTILPSAENKSGDKDDDGGGSSHPWQQAERQPPSTQLKSEAAITRPHRESGSGSHERDLSPSVARDSRPAAAAAAAHLGPNLVVTSQASVHGFGTAEGLAAPWMTGPPVWLQPGYPMPHPGAPTAIPVDPAHIPVTPPTGYKLAQDSLTGHLYFVPEVVLEQSSKWGSNYGVNQPPVVISHPLSHPHILPQAAPLLPGQATSQTEPPDRPAAAQPLQQRVTPVQTWLPPKQEVKPHKQEVVTPRAVDTPPAPSKVAPPPAEGISQKACKDGVALQKPSSLQTQRTLARAPPLKATVAPQQHHRPTKQEPQSPTDLPGLPAQDVAPASTASSQPPSGSTASAETTSTTTTTAEDSSRNGEEGSTRSLQVPAVLPGIPVAPGQAYPLVYPSTMPYLCDTNLVQLHGVPMPTTASSKPSTQDRACSPIVFPPSSTTTTTTSTTTDTSCNTNEVVLASVSVQTVEQQRAEKSEMSSQTCDTNSQPFQCHTCQNRRDSAEQTGPPPKFERSTSTTKGVADYLFDLSGPILSQLANEESGQNSPAPSLPSTPSCFSPVARFLDDKSCSRSLEGTSSDLISSIPQVSQASDGLELLSILAEHAQKQQIRNTKADCDDTEEEEDDTPDINKNYNVPKPHMVEPKRERKDSVCSSSKMGAGMEYDNEALEEYVQGGFRITAAGIDGMDVLELEMRMRLAELQRRYKEKQRELARLQPRREEDRNRDRGPGRPRKRKSKSKSTDSCSKSPRSDATTDTDTSTTGQPIIKKKKILTPKPEEKSKPPAPSLSTLSASQVQATEKTKSTSVVVLPGKLTESPAKTTAVKKKTTTTTTSTVTTTTTTTTSQAKSDKVVKPANVNVTTTPVKSKTAAVKTKTPAKTASKTDKSTTSTSTPVIQSKKRPTAESSRTPSKKTPIVKREKAKTPREASALRKKEEHVRRLDESDEREDDSDDSQIEDVSWLFDEDEINPPEAVLSGISHAGKDTKPSSTWSQDQRNTLSTSQSETGMLSHYTSSSANDMDYMCTSVAAATSAALKSKKRKKSPDDTGLEDSEFDDNPVKKRKPGRPKKLESDGSTETIVSRKHEHKQMALLSMKPQQKTTKKTKPKASDRKSEKDDDDDDDDESDEDTGPVLKDEWFIRRSERIFLSDPTLTTPVDTTPKSTASATKTTSSSSSATTLAIKSKVTKDKPQVKVLHEASQQVKKKYTKTLSYTPSKSVTATSSTSSTTVTVSSGSSSNKPCPYDYPSSSSPSSSSSSSSSSTPSSSDSDSSSDADNVPLSTLRERPATPKPRSCVIEKEELKDGLSVLFFMEGLFYESQVKAIQPPDVYGVLVDGERGNRPHIMSQEELLNQAILDVQPASLQWLPESTRVCAYWSQQFSCLYPGTVAKGSPNPDEDKGLICVEFDDGDSGRIPLEHIRMLPKDYPIVDIDPNPLIVMGGRRRRRTMSEDGKERPEGKSRNPSISDTLSSYHLAEEALFKRHSPAKVPKKKAPEASEQKTSGTTEATTSKTDASSSCKSAATLTPNKSSGATSASKTTTVASKSTVVMSIDKSPVTTKSSSQGGSRSTSVLTSKSSLTCNTQSKQAGSEYTQGKTMTSEATGLKSLSTSSISVSKASCMSSAPKPTVVGFSSYKSPLAGSTSSSSTSSTGAAATSTTTKPTLAPSKLSSTILTASKQALTFTLAKPTSLIGTTAKSSAPALTPIKQTILPGKLTPAGEKKKIQSILKGPTLKKEDFTPKQSTKTKEKSPKEKSSQKAEESRTKDGDSKDSSLGESLVRKSSTTPKKTSVTPLTVDTKSMSVSSVSLGSKSMSPGSTCTISPGGGSELTMRIRTNSCEGADFTRCNETSEESESSTNSSEKSSEQTSETTSSSCDDEDSRSSDFSDSEESSEAVAERTSAPSTPSTTATTTHQGNKKVSPSSSTGSTGKPAKRKERNLSGEKSRIAAFLPARQLWRWSGKGTKRPGMKGRAKKEYFKAIQRGKEILRVGDCAVFLSTGRPHLPYVGRIESLWEAWGGNMVVKVKWFYHPEETKGGKRLAEVRGALYQSPHVDENDVQTISHRCEVVPYSTYRLHKQAKGNVDADNNDLYYLAGTYDPTIGMITFEADVKVL